MQRNGKKSFKKKENNPINSNKSDKNVSKRKFINIIKGKPDYFPFTIRLMSFSLFSASSGVRLFTSRFRISSRIWHNTGSSS